MLVWLCIVCEAHYVCCLLGGSVYCWIAVLGDSHLSILGDLRILGERFHPQAALKYTLWVVSGHVPRKIESSRANKSSVVIIYSWYEF